MWSRNVRKGFIILCKTVFRHVPLSYRRHTLHIWAGKKTRKLRLVCFSYVWLKTQFMTVLLSRHICKQFQLQDKRKKDQTELQPYSSSIPGERQSRETRWLKRKLIKSPSVWRSDVHYGHKKGSHTEIGRYKSWAQINQLRSNLYSKESCAWTWSTRLKNYCAITCSPKIPCLVSFICASTSFCPV